MSSIVWDNTVVDSLTTVVETIAKAIIAIVKFLICV